MAPPSVSRDDFWALVTCLVPLSRHYMLFFVCCTNKQHLPQSQETIFEHLWCIWCRLAGATCFFVCCTNKWHLPQSALVTHLVPLSRHQLGNLSGVLILNSRYSIWLVLETLPLFKSVTIFFILFCILCQTFFNTLLPYCIYSLHKFKEEIFDIATNVQLTKIRIAFSFMTWQTNLVVSRTSQVL